MSKKNNDRRDNRDRRDNHKSQEFKIPEDAKKLAKLTLKKFKKEEGDYYDKKKDLKRGYYDQLIEYLPASLALCVKYGHFETVRETRDQIYEKIVDPKFAKYLQKEIAKNDLTFDNMLLLPVVISDITAEASKAEAAEKAENPDAETSYDVTELVALSQIILKKPLKKMKEAGIDEKLAFDALSVIPTVKILEKSPYYHIRKLFNVLYAHAKEKEVKFDAVIKQLFKKNEEQINHVIIFALLERKDKLTTLNTTQQRLFNDITEYCFKEMEKMSKTDIRFILKGYVNSRKKDEEIKKDSNRRYYISSLPETDYPKIISVVNAMLHEDESIKSYF